ncbi:RagB/SusD family nutrient uptake outer membrane protein [Hymenobacter sp. GOD-10R]|uniref:RagB/SusD family nutrient uptake outer membrane protein n=1 Tax=Hymenobacter sp. GOD-10R TaxID=3093922 RepID=UPI002D77BDA4|nr:RagB/SusD family nutrient uptake outer membrane protein [Hymenobacter sp. GOD-10R]WRQ31557.1 RagB/SusD family nutrient uptake outer membrane protein [Hymenobacter sp. GOD-10R]
MKRYFFRALLAATSLAAAAGTFSCKDYLDVLPGSAYTNEMTFNSVSNVNSAVIGAYDPLSGDNGYGVRLSTGYAYDTDEGQNRAGAPDGGSRDVNRYRVTAGTTELTAPFNTLYQGVERANICIEQIPKMALFTSGTLQEQQQLRRLYAESLALRALYYLEITRNWGDVPAPFEPAPLNGDVAIASTDRNIIYDRLLDDLGLASRYLPWRNQADYNAYERFTKGAVKALRARIALYRGGYQSREGKMVRAGDYLDAYRVARAECDTLIRNRDQHTLNPSFETIWRNVSGLKFDTQYGEIMFEVAMGSGSAASDSKLGFNNGPRLSQLSRWGQTGGAISILPTYFYAFDSTDTRRDVTITLYRSVDATPNTLNSVTATSITDGKFRRDWRVPLLSGTSQNLGMNWPVVRFADVLLMFAEAQNELAGPTAAYNGTTPVQALEEVRKRAFPAATYKALPVSQTGTKDAFFTALVNERWLEFGGESIRKYDLIRWNLLATKIAETKANLTAFMSGTGAYARVPQYLYEYNIMPEQLRYARSLYRPAPSTATTFNVTVNGTTYAARRVSWRQAVTATSIADVASAYVPGTGDELLAFPQTVVDTNPNLKQNYGY